MKSHLWWPKWNEKAVAPRGLGGFRDKVWRNWLETLILRPKSLFVRTAISFISKNICLEGWAMQGDAEDFWKISTKLHVQHRAWETRICANSPSLLDLQSLTQSDHFSRQETAEPLLYLRLFHHTFFSVFSYSLLNLTIPTMYNTFLGVKRITRFRIISELL